MSQLDALSSGHESEARPRRKTHPTALDKYLKLPWVVQLFVQYRYPLAPRAPRGPLLRADRLVVAYPLRCAVLPARHHLAAFIFSSVLLAIFTLVKSACKTAT